MPIYCLDLDLRLVRLCARFVIMHAGKLTFNATFRPLCIFAQIDMDYNLYICATGLYMSHFRVQNHKNHFTATGLLGNMVYWAKLN